MLKMLILILPTRDRTYLAFIYLLLIIHEQTYNYMLRLFGKKCARAQ
jgi:hypothetical protein